MESTLMEFHKAAFVTSLVVAGAAIGGVMVCNSAAGEQSSSLPLEEPNAIQRANGTYDDYGDVSLPARSGPLGVRIDASSIPTAMGLGRDVNELRITFDAPGSYRVNVMKVHLSGSRGTDSLNRIETIISHDFQVTSAGTTETINCKPFGITSKGGIVEVVRTDETGGQTAISPL